MKIILTGGGTGGHIYPALAIAKMLKKLQPDVELLYIGTKHGLEATIVPRESIAYKQIMVDGFPRKVNFSALKSFLKLMLGLLQSFKIIKKFNPQIIIATGGYVSGPVGWAGAVLGIPLIIHEQNAFPGITNKLLATKATKICITFADSKRHFPNQEKIIITGLPVRKEIITANKEQAMEKLGLKSDKKTILVVGGSRGAQKINKVVLQSLNLLEKKSNIQLIIITGESEFKECHDKLIMQEISDDFRNNIIMKPYMHNIEYALAAADLVVGRAGAAFVAEITVRGIPAILVPYPYATENHQYENAMSLVRTGAAVLIKDIELTEKKLVDVIEGLLKDDGKQLSIMEKASRAMGKPDALDNIITVIKDTIKSDKGWNS